jgi:nicotinamide mononucleotide transporter
MRSLLRVVSWVALIAASVGLLAASHLHTIPLDRTEVFGFVTGAACVLLVIDENIWNFPVGIANNVFFIVLFLRHRLYGDMALQFAYVALGLAGWWQWARGGPDREPLHVTRAGPREWAGLGLAGVAATAAGTLHLRRVGGASPFLDALTTVLSLIAQWLLNRKRIDNWYVWIAADLLYVGLYVTRALYLTAALYAIFIFMCLAGLRSWRRSLST